MSRYVVNGANAIHREMEDMTLITLNGSNRQKGEVEQWRTAQPPRCCPSFTLLAMYL